MWVRMRVRVRVWVCVWVLRRQSELILSRGQCGQRLRLRATRPVFKVSLMRVVVMQRRVLRDRGQRTLSQPLLQPRLLVWQVWQQVETQVLL